MISRRCERDRLRGKSLERTNDLNQMDVVTGGKGNDNFQLGDIVRSFYIGDGDKGFARITDFESGDTLILNGNVKDYTLKMARLSQVTGSGRRAKTTTISGMGIYQGDDLIALIQGKASNGLNLSNPNQVLFI